MQVGDLRNRSMARAAYNTMLLASLKRDTYADEYIQRLPIIINYQLYCLIILLIINYVFIIIVNY